MAETGIGGRPGLWTTLCLWVLVSSLAIPDSRAGEFRLVPETPTLDRWVYFMGDFLGDRSVAPTFASFDPRFDTRDGQVLLGWDTAELVATNAGPRQYLIRLARVTVSVTVGNSFIYDPTFDSFLSYATNQLEYEPDLDPGRPVELYGAAFRNGFTAESFKENSPYGKVNPFTSDSITIATRNAFAAMFGTEGTLIDIANNVGQANAAWTNAPFEVRPWAIGVTSQAQPGELVPQDSAFSFEVDLRDPLVVGYLQSALNEGRLRLFLSSLSPATQVTPGGVGGGGSGAYPQWATRENLLTDPPRLEVEGALVGPEDNDSDGLPDDWERFYLGNLDTSALDDPDFDGESTVRELEAGTNPNAAASVFRLELLSLEPDGIAILGFPVAPSRRYRVESSTNLHDWVAAQGSLSFPEPGRARFVEAMLNGPPSPRQPAFFRVVIE